MNRVEAGIEPPHREHGIPAVSFSGVDGAGKSTQIELLRSFLEERGLRVRIVKFWDDVAALTQLRESAGHRIFMGEKGVGTPEAPVNRRDKNVRGWPMTCLRLFIYLLDALSLRRVYRRIARSGVDFVIFDRFIYDELANLDLNRRALSAYSRFIRRLVPKPGMSFVLDANPEAARARKPEYPLEFLFINRNAYLNLGRMFQLTVIPSGDIETVHSEVLTESLLLLCPLSSEPADSLGSVRVLPTAVGPSLPRLRREAGKLK